jgi:hypothetical protein
VDLLKIDAEGHELPVLEGSQLLIERFAPIILYENIAANQGSNLANCRWLKGKGYRLYRYRPYLQELLEIESEADLQGNFERYRLTRTGIKGLRKPSIKKSSRE